jgi:hypothetical protein
VCVFSNILLILLAIASSVLEPQLLDLIILPLFLPQTLLIVPLLLQLLCLTLFTFSARSGALQLFKYQLQIPFLGRWMLPIIVLSLSIICLGTLSRAYINTASQVYQTFYRIITITQLVLHLLHLLNLAWGFVHYLWTWRPRHYQPIQLSPKTTAHKSKMRLSTSSGHLSKAYLRVSESRNRQGFQVEQRYQIQSGGTPEVQTDNSPNIDISNRVRQVQVIDYDNGNFRREAD